MKPVPRIDSLMTPTPHTIGGDQSVGRAKQMMHDHGIRHLPVLQGGKLIGVLTERDVRLIDTLTRREGDMLQVADAMTEAPYTTAPDRPIDEVATEMAEHKLGSAIVVQRGKVVGIFTTTDACRALAAVFAEKSDRGA